MYWRTHSAGTYGDVATHMNRTKAIGHARRWQSYE